MKIDDFNIVPILDGKKIVGFDISIQDKRIEEVGFHIKDGHIQITSITAYEMKGNELHELQEYKRKLEKNITESILFYRNSDHNTKETRNSDLGAIGALINLKVSLGFSLFRWENLMYEGKYLPF